MMPKLKIGLVVVAILVVANLVVFSPRLKTLWNRAAEQRKLAADQKRKKECNQELADQFDAQKLVGTPSAKIADCLPFAVSKRELDDGRTSYTFQHPTKKNQEAPADIGIIVDSKSKTIVHAELLYYDW